MRYLGVAALLALAGGLVAVPAGASTAALRGDTVVLPNLDDDSRRCLVTDAQLDALGSAVDDELAACNDAGDDVVNGRADERDLARLTARGAEAGRVTVSGRAHVFVRRGGSWTPAATLSAAELRDGVELGVEATDVRRPDWDGRVTVTLTSGERVVSHHLRVAPLLLQHDLQPVTTAFAARPGGGAGHPDGWTWIDGSWEPHDWESFSAGLRSAPMRYLTGTDTWWQDVWWQDFFEPAYARAGGQTMRFAIRSANIWDIDGVRTPRPAARAVFRDLRGPDVAVVQELVDDGRDAVQDLRNATGNIESLPPYEGYPRGRLVYGSDPSGELTPDPAFVGLLTSQDQQPPVVVDTSWLLVGHTDETTHVVRAANDRGWTLMAADPRLALATMRSAQAGGRGDARFTGRDTGTIDEVLADPTVLADNEEAARHVDDQLSVLLAETGLRADEVVRVPVLFRKVASAGLFVAATPGIPNGLSVNAQTFAAPDPHAPVVNGVDIFKSVAERALRGVHVDWVEDLGWAHLGGGEVHCTTNAWRAF
ncbi:protein-arginine deiminase family protein [Actinophytocola oryzae]|uniref:Protein-arginine deiminase n=1 Tax=Actinophytocola oryzae TaxID=502181 RepID=A0A4R7V930_9PSEU|nr:protein-arginine deiminase family protein [Actinophytocola oryzae]TDV45415.1 protein-arginine deiminase [Actinophytocola oryzae]